MEEMATACTFRVFVSLAGSDADGVAAKVVRLVRGEDLAQTLERIAARFDDATAAVVAGSGGSRLSMKAKDGKMVEIEGVDDLEPDDCVVFHAQAAAPAPLLTTAGKRSKNSAASPMESPAAGGSESTEEDDNADDDDDDEEQEILRAVAPEAAEDPDLWVGLPPSRASAVDARRRWPIVPETPTVGVGRDSKHLGEQHLQSAATRTPATTIGAAPESAELLPFPPRTASRQPCIQTASETTAREEPMKRRHGPATTAPGGRVGCCTARPSRLGVVWVPAVKVGLLMVTQDRHGPRSWKKRRCVLEQTQMVYYEVLHSTNTSPTRRRVQGSISFHDTAPDRVFVTDSSVFPGHDNIFQMETREQGSYFMQASSSDDMNEWLELLWRAITAASFPSPRKELGASGSRPVIR